MANGGVCHLENGKLPENGVCHDLPSVLPPEKGVETDGKTATQRGVPPGDDGKRMANGAPPAPALLPSNKERSRFVRPTLEEVTAYCRERKNSVDPRRFFDYYEARGWRLRNGSMKDWKAAVRYWEGNGFSSGNGDAEEAINYRT
jgi:hypothetical protein